MTLLTVRGQVAGPPEKAFEDHRGAEEVSQCAWVTKMAVAFSPGAATQSAKPAIVDTGFDGHYAGYFNAASQLADSIVVAGCRLLGSRACGHGGAVHGPGGITACEAGAGREGRADVLTPGAMADFLGRLIAELGLGTPHLVAPDVGASAALFLAARHPDAVRSLVVGGGGAAYPLDVTGTLAEIIAAPGIEVFEGQDIRATIGATVEPAAPRGQEPDVWEDYVSAYEDGRFAQSTRYVRSYPEQLLVLRDLLPAIRVPVHVFAAADDPLVPVSNGRYLADRIPGSELTILPASHFAWEEVPDQFAAIVADWVTRAEDAKTM